MGLLVGCSVLSLVEILDFFVHNTIVKLRAHPEMRKSARDKKQTSCNGDEESQIREHRQYELNTTDSFGKGSC